MTSGNKPSPEIVFVRRFVKHELFLRNYPLPNKRRSFEAEVILLNLRLMIVGVKRRGKTTTIGEARATSLKRRNDILIAADAFRAAAFRPVGVGLDARSSVFKTGEPIRRQFYSTRWNPRSTRNSRLFGVDTAGRYNKSNLMANSKNKAHRRARNRAPHETLLVIDAL